MTQNLHSIFKKRLVLPGKNLGWLLSRVRSCIELQLCLISSFTPQVEDADVAITQLAEKRLEWKVLRAQADVQRLRGHL